LSIENAGVVNDGNRIGGKKNQSCVNADVNVDGKSS
jgi:hypothetical protein